MKELSREYREAQRLVKELEQENEDLLAKYNTEKIALEPSNNTLYIFPSWLQHSVEPNKNKNILRKSISFNFISLYI